jgi:hypothetical protein
MVFGRFVAAQLQNVPTPRPENRSGQGTRSRGPAMFRRSEINQMRGRAVDGEVRLRKRNGTIGTFTAKRNVVVEAKAKPVDDAYEQGRQDQRKADAELGGRARSRLLRRVRGDAAVSNGA